MQDLSALEGKTLAELREIGKVLGITDTTLKKKELLTKIAESANTFAGDATEDSTTDNAAETDKSPVPTTSPPVLLAKSIRICVRSRAWTFS